jgi:hypothetical protein
LRRPQRYHERDGVGAGFLAADHLRCWSLGVLNRDRQTRSPAHYTDKGAYFSGRRTMS